MNCIICNGESKKIFNHLILNKYDIDYFQCQNCKAIFTEKPYWMSEAYSDAIVSADTGIMARNISLSMRANMIISKYFNPDCKFLDFAGGAGMFVRLMRDRGFDFYWRDKYADNLCARGFEYTGEKVELITAFEVFEHFDNPKAEISEMLQSSDSILFSTLIYDDEFKVKDPGWWYYSFGAGQHITFYSKITLEYLAKQNGLNYYYINQGLHLFSKKKLNERKLQRICNSKMFVAIKWLKNGRASYTVSDMEFLNNKKITEDKK